MITIPAYHYEDDTLKFVCPALKLRPDKAHKMLMALADPTWSSMLSEVGYICHALAALGFDSQVVSDALVDRYSCIALDGCVSDTMDGATDLAVVLIVAHKIRVAWCNHMRTYLEQALS